MNSIDFERITLTQQEINHRTKQTFKKKFQSKVPIEFNNKGENVKITNTICGDKKEKNILKNNLKIQRISKGKEEYKLSLWRLRYTGSFQNSNKLLNSKPQSLKKAILKMNLITLQEKIELKKSNGNSFRISRPILNSFPSSMKNPSTFRDLKIYHRKIQPHIRKTFDDELFKRNNDHLNPPLPIESQLLQRNTIYLTSLNASNTFSGLMTIKSLNYQTKKTTNQIGTSRNISKVPNLITFSQESEEYNSPGTDNFTISNSKKFPPFFQIVVKRNKDLGVS